MPMDRSRYPADWEALSKRIRERDGNACACKGECDDEHPAGRCGAPNGADIVRLDAKPARWALAERMRQSDDRWGAVVRVVLTVAHLDHDPANNDPANLKALCQRCHLRLDRHQHAKNAAATRRRKRDEGSGQLALEVKDA